MVELRIPAVVLLLPLLLMGAALGLRRGWARETLTGLGLAVILVAFDRLVAVALAAITFVGRVAGEIARSAGVGAPRLDSLLNRAPRGLIVLVFAVIFLVVAYKVGHMRGNKGGDTRYGKLAGAVVGALNVLLLLAIVSARASDVLGAARLRRLFLVPGSGRGVEMEVPPFPSAAVLAQWSAYAVVVLMLIAFGWGLTRLPKLRG